MTVAGRRPLELKVDPVCRMTVDAAAARFAAERDDGIYYFCSGYCQRRFEAAARRIAELTREGRVAGSIVEVMGPMVDIECDRLPPLHQALEAVVEHGLCTLEVRQHLDERRARAVALHKTSGRRRGMWVFDTGGPLRVPVSPDCLGLILDVFGDPLDGREPLGGDTFRPTLSSPASLAETTPAAGVLQTGIKVIDLLCPFIRGGCMGLFGGAGVGKTVLVMEFM
ncbi:MAG: YHS domain-containing protein, partial [Elusimicrobia bacterium]|nr:YHS domain-containing protein [Elusimicrobiota bacterium]